MRHRAVRITDFDVCGQKNRYYSKEQAWKEAAILNEESLGHVHGTLLRLIKIYDNAHSNNRVDLIGGNRLFADQPQEVNAFATLMQLVDI